MLLFNSAVHAQIKCQDDSLRYPNQRILLSFDETRDCREHARAFRRWVDERSLSVDDRPKADLVSWLDFNLQLGDEAHVDRDGRITVTRCERREALRGTRLTPAPSVGDGALEIYLLVQIPGTSDECLLR